MSDEVHTDTDELRRLGAAFATHAYDLGRHLSDFKRRTDAEALRQSLGGSEDAERYAELSELAGSILGQLQDQLDEMGSGMRTGAIDTEATELDMAALIRGVR
ncbi:hypothetical protein [Streptomyces sp. NPDC048639]|uniref:hypothetical protein n=1 Tax=Streptomyces sp. NPDC048639 TaxID=3365581 RepID=UPI003723F5E3